MTLQYFLTHRLTLLMMKLRKCLQANTNSFKVKLCSVICVICSNVDGSEATALGI